MKSLLIVVSLNKDTSRYILFYLHFSNTVSSFLFELQCEKAREICKTENVGLVFVSPLRRALETCKEIFHGHSTNPKIVPHPLFREMILSNCDIGAKILESK